MMKLENGFVEASGTVAELLADYAVATKTIWNDVLDGRGEGDKLKAIFGILSVAFSHEGDYEDEDEDTDDDPLSDMVREALRKEFEDE